MKYCSKCGAQLVDEAVVCVNCGCATEAYVQETASSNSGLKSAAKILMVVGTVCTSLMCFLIPLAWCIPMTVSYFKKVKNNLPVSMGFKVCTLIFVNTIAGILMLCDKDN